MQFLVRYSEDLYDPVTIDDGHEVIVGRDPDKCQLVVLDAQASHVHCSLSVMGGRGWIEDLGSTNGTFVNDERVETALLSEGDVIRIGQNGRCTLHVGVRNTDDIPAARLRPHETAWP
jgi:pSer/pThr/pTyr-binding forkhead associated (FHA) protein